MLKHYLLLLLISLSLAKVPNDETIEIGPDNYPRRDDPDNYYVAIFHTNDLHGGYFPKPVTLPSGKKYKTGGMEYLARYYKILQEEWEDRILFLDGADQFQGGLESRLSRGQVIMDFFNTMNIDKSTLGNHEFDWGVSFMKDYMNKADFTWLTCNLRDKDGKDKFLPKQELYQVVQVGEVKIGIIGLTTVETVTSTAADLEGITFKDYKELIEKYSKFLRDQEKVNAVILLAHVGLYCRYDDDSIKHEIKVRDKNTEQQGCRESDEAVKLLNVLEPGTIDLFLAGHRHDVTHHWVNKVAIASNFRNAAYSHVVYLPFDKETKKLKVDEIKMEGPFPSCEKVFKNKKRCDITVASEQEEKDAGDLVDFTFHGKPMQKEESLKNISEKYYKMVEPYYDDYLTKTKTHLESEKEREGAMGNFYCDFMRHISGADIAVTNSGGFRAPIYMGDVTNATVYGVDPFGNKLIKFKMKGYEVKKMFRQVQPGSKGWYPFSGLRQIVRDTGNRREFIDVKLFDGVKESELIDDQDYTVASTNYLFPEEGQGGGGDDFVKVSKWFRVKDFEVVKHGSYNNTRDMFIEYLRNMDEIKAERYYDPNNPRMRVLGTDNYYDERR